MKIFINLFIVIFSFCIFASNEKHIQQLKIDKMHCEKCADQISTSIMDEISPSSVNINVSTNQLIIIDDEPVPTKSILSIIKRLGYGVSFNKDYRIKVKVDGIVCSFCIIGIKKNFEKIKSVTDVDFDLDKGVLNLITSDDHSLTNDKIREIFLDAGYEVKQIDR